MEILQIGEPVLRQMASSLSRDEITSESIQQLISAMIETLRNAPGVGLAAPQIGESLQLVVIEDRAEYIQKLSPEQAAERERSPVPLHVLINPKIIKQDDTKAEFFEGCMSTRGLMGLVPRALSVKVECLNEHGENTLIEARGWYARILQHEIDHLHGIINLDR